MRISTKTSIALHLLVLLEIFKDKKLTSELLAMSVGCNAVMVRNMLGSLKKAGLVDVQRGSGGASLAVDPEDVTIWDVYQAVDTVSPKELIGLHPNPSAKCPVGSKIYDLLEKPYDAVADSVKTAMSRYTLQQIVDDYYASLI
jgi:DNA-binding IscR family transcriptional regulator